MSGAIPFEQLSPHKYAAFLFDCDGTLVNSAPAHFRSMRWALDAHSVPLEVTEESFRRLSGVSTGEMFRQLSREQDVALGDFAGLVASARAAFKAELPELRPIEHVIEFAKARHESAPLAIVSGSSMDNVQSILDALEIGPLFRTIVTPDGELPPKPAPDIFLEAAARLGVAAEDCLVFEDSELGFQAATAAGMDYVQVLADPAPWA